jgi:hypothetical protein
VTCPPVLAPSAPGWQRYSAGLPAPGCVVFGITINDRDELFATNRKDHEVVKFRLSR